MPVLVSKLQYKTCEKGEYYEEKPRNLDETIQLINDFPWYKEKFASIELTGPSITILDNKGNFLKVGIHYGGKYHLYYLDEHKKFYECYPLDIEQVYNYVNDFFAGCINLQKFEKHFIGLGKKSYFITKSFIYTIKTWKILWFLGHWIILLLFALAICVSLIVTNQTGFVLIIALFIALALSILIYKQFFKFHTNRFEYLQISRGNNIFIFGEDSDNVKEYNKADIDKIINYTPKNTRSPNVIEFMEIVFKDGASIRFPNILLSSSGLDDKFADYWKLRPIIIEKNTLSMN